jgi:hypothetical protein
VDLNKTPYSSASFGRGGQGGNPGLCIFDILDKKILFTQLSSMCQEIKMYINLKTE